MNKIIGYIGTLLMCVLGGLVGMALSVPFWKGLLIGIFVLIITSGINGLIILLNSKLKKVIDGSKHNA